MERVKNVTRIALVSEHASPLALLGGNDAGGQNVYIDEISRHLAKLGYAVDIFTRRDQPTLPEVVDMVPGVRVVNVEAGPVEPRSKDEIWPYMPIFRDWCLDFIQRNTMAYDVIHSNFWMSGWVATELRQRLGIPVVHIYHALGATKRRHQGAADTSPGQRLAIEAQLARDVDYLITSCPNEEAELIQEYGAPSENIRMIPLGVNSKTFRPTGRFRARRHLNLSLHDFIIVYVGRILPRKDVRNIVRALPVLQQRCRGDRRVPAMHLVVVGGESGDSDPVATPEIGELQRLAQELGVATNVQFTGNRRQELLRYYYSAADVVVTTPWYEPFGLTPLEGMACARPVVGSEVGGIMYSIVDGETGLLVPPQQPEALADRLYYLLKHPQDRERMGAAARERVLRHFSWSRVAENTSRVYEEALMQPSLPLDIFHTPWSDLLDVPSVGGGE